MLSHLSDREPELHERADYWHWRGYWCGVVDAAAVCLLLGLALGVAIHRWW